MSEMVERVAKALCTQLDGDTKHWQCFVSDARTAIDAMRDFNTEDFTLTEAAGVRRLFDEALNASSPAEQP